MVLEELFSLKDPHFCPEGVAYLGLSGSAAVPLVPEIWPEMAAAERMGVHCSQSLPPQGQELPPVAPPPLQGSAHVYWWPGAHRHHKSAPRSVILAPFGGETKLEIALAELQGLLGLLNRAEVLATSRPPTRCKLQFRRSKILLIYVEKRLRGFFDTPNSDTHPRRALSCTTPCGATPCGHWLQ